MNTNRIRIDGFSNEQSEARYRAGFPDEPDVYALYFEGQQCGGCSFFAPFDSDWGLCCHAQSPHHLETVFEHFTCRNYVGEGWGPHSFSADPDHHCRCEGEDLPEEL